MRNLRASGVLMHLTSLPSPHGIGTMGADAIAFVDFLAAAGQRYWQILPICPTGLGDSPYQTVSSFAGNPYLIDLDLLQAQGLLLPEDYQHLDWGDAPAAVDFGLLYRQRYPVLRAACKRLLRQPPADYADFCVRHGDWLEDYALFMALKQAQGGTHWLQWPTPLRLRDVAALAEAREAHSEEIAFWKGVQYLFFSQWGQIKAYANSRGISLIGDLPIYVSRDSVDTWAHPRQFQLDEQLQPTEVAGCPPDAFSELGQLWGNPLFDWAYMKRTGYDWWIRRIRHQCQIYDVLRIDHFRGFESYYAIPWGATDAREGRWRPGPGMELFQAVEEALGPQRMIAEDLGMLTPAVHQLLEDTGFPGMKVLEFAFDTRGGQGSAYLPHNIQPHSVAYTGTHDNDTALGWMATAPATAVEYAREYLRIGPWESPNWAMMRTIWASPANTAIVQMQDLLDLGSEARMNQPATVGRNWRWRALPGFDSPRLAARLRKETEIYCRLP